MKNGGLVEGDDDMFARVEEDSDDKNGEITQKKRKKEVMFLELEDIEGQ